MKLLNTSLCLCLFIVLRNTSAQESVPLPGTQPLTLQGDFSAKMVEGIDKFLLREIDRSVEERPKLWHRDFSSREGYEKSVAPNRERFRKLIGAVDPRLPVRALEYVGSTVEPSLVAEIDRYTVHAVRWPAFEGVFRDGVL